MKKLIESLVEREIQKQTKTQKILNETQVLTEANIWRVMKKYFDLGFIIISADRTCEAELGRECTPEEVAQQEKQNKQNEQNIKQDIRSAGFGFVPSYGGFREKTGEDPETGEDILDDAPNPEMSFIVPMQKVGSYKQVKGSGEILKKLGVQLSQKYNQDSFFYKPPNKEDQSAYFIDKEGQEDMKFENFTINDLSQIYYTELRKKKQRFSALPENKQFVLFIPKSPSSVTEARKRYGEYFFNFKRKNK